MGWARIGRWVAWFTLASLTLYRAAPRAQAQADVPGPESVQEPAGYTQLMDEAVSEYELRHFAEARALFARGAALYPNARAWRGLGMAEFELRDYTDALGSLEQALSSDVKRLEGPLREETEQLLERARRFVGRVVLTLEPPSTQVILDGGPAANPRDLLLEVGDHTLELRAEGYIPERRVLKVRGGELESLRVALARPTVAVSLAPSPVQDAPPSRPLYKNPWLWTGVGVAVAAVAVGLAVGLGGSGDSPQRRGSFAGVINGP
jgi:tetratricopeptide (TPR) repeat protein